MDVIFFIQHCTSLKLDTTNNLISVLINSKSDYLLAIIPNPA